LPANRVHPIDVPMAKFMNCLSGWGLGTKDLLPAMRRESGNRVEVNSTRSQP